MASKGIPASATARLKQDFLRLNKDPVPYVRATPLPSNILTWHYIVNGPENTPYEGGIYHGKLVFPREYPFKPPAIYMITPNGRFKVNQKLCLSISDFHPDTWNPAWSVSTILTGLLSFMLENTPTSGSTESNDATKRRLAQESKSFNIKDKLFCELFPDVVDEINKSIEKKLNEEAAAAAAAAAAAQEAQLNAVANNVDPARTNSANPLQPNNSWLFSVISNIFVMLGLAAFAFVVRYVFNTVN